MTTDTALSHGGSEPTAAGSGRRRSVLRLPTHLGTTAHVCSLYPWSVQSGLGHRGCFIGADLLAAGTAFCWDPFEAYAQGLVTNPNTWIMGEPGNGKSALVKTLLWRMRGVYGSQRFFAIVDPKGEYSPLAERLGLPVVRLAPGGSVRVNPMASASGADPAAQTGRQARMVGALAATVLGRDLAPLEEKVIWEVADRLSRHGPGSPSLLDVAAMLGDPPAEVRARLGRKPAELSAGIEPVVFALDKLLSRSLRGMFDGNSTVALDWDGPGVVLDLSAVYSDTEALPVVMVAALAWLQEALMGTDRRKVQLLDEVWGLLGSRHAAGWLQATWKLGRSHGIANIGVSHRPSDLVSQADDGTATSKIAAGLLADSATKVVMRQAPDQLVATREILGLTEPQVQAVRQLVRGRAVWRLGSNTAVVQHQIGPGEWDLVDTDAHMRAPVNP